MIDLDRDLCLAFDDVEVRHQKPVFVENKSGAKPARGADLDHGLAKEGDDVSNVADGCGFGVRKIEAGFGLGFILRVRGRGGHWRLGMFGRSFGTGGFGDLCNLVAWDDQDSVTDINYDLVAFLGQDASRNGGFAL